MITTNDNDSMPGEGCLLRIRAIMPGLKPSEKKVAQCMIENPEKVVDMSVTELSRASGTSDSTVVKFSQKLGYSGFQELKIRLARELPLFHPQIHGDITHGDDLESIKIKIFRANERAISDTCRAINSNELDRAVNALATAQRIIFFGSGASGIVALDAEQKFLRIGKECHGFNDAHMAAVVASLCDNTTAVVGISHSGATRDTVRVLEVAKQAQAVTICLTNFLNSPITSAADIVLLTSVQESDFRSGAIASRVAQLSVLDVLFVAVAQKQYETTMRCLQITREAVADKRF